MGTPSIAPVRGAIVEFTKHNYSSFLVETRNTGDIACMIDFVLSHPDTAVEVSERMKNKVKTDFSVERHTQMVLEVYNSLM
jgi:glycosyltransferase involved in cell wall biosynthesis